MKKFLITILFALTTLTSCATYDPETNSYSDPMEGFNRTMFNFNYNVLDPYIVRPAAVFWKSYIPKPVRIGISNVTSNLSEPASMVNYLLQGEGKKAAIHFTRFFLNTVFGPYVVLPFYGQATLREDGGDVVDFLYPPLSLLTSELVITKWIFQGLETRAQFLEYEDMLNNSSDPYSFMRQAYFQRHDFLAADGNVDTSQQQKREEAVLGDFLDEIDE